MDAPNTPRVCIRQRQVFGNPIASGGVPVSGRSRRPRGAQNGPATLKFSACLHLPPFCAQMGIGFYDLLAIARLQTAGG